MTDVQDYPKQWLISAVAEAPLLIISQDQDALTDSIAWLKKITVCQEQSAPCGVCLPCLQAESNIHPDILEISGTEKTISLTSIQGLLEAARQKPWHKKKLLVIPQAERLTREAVSALLKTLEEPSPTCRTLLTTSYKNKLLKTLLSRCHALVLPNRQSETAPVFQEPLPKFGLQVEPLNSQQLSSVAAYLAKQISLHGFSPALYRSYLRLRDYYKISSLRGNAKLASDVLLSTLEQIRP